VPEKTIEMALTALLSPKPAEAIGIERSIESETNLGPPSSDLIENLGSDWASFEDIDPEFIYTFLEM
jgi:hypothetical protein